MKRGLLAGLVLLLSFTLLTHADPPPEFDYQGKILVGDVPLTGPGYFKYAIANQSGTTNFWAHDGTTVGEPATFITNDCYNGVFSAMLGGAPMTDIDPEIFAPETSLFLRVWFSDDGVTFNEMLPAQDLLSVPYAMNAHMLDGLHAVDIIARATNAVTLSGDISGTPGGGTTVDSLQGGSLDIGALAGGEVLTWDGSAWTNAPAPGGGGMDPAIASNSFVIKTGDTMTGVLGINVGPDNDLVITNSGDTIRIGRETSGTNAGIAIGPQSYADNRAVAIGGQFAFADDQGVAVGYQANAFNSGVAIGYYATGYESGASVGASASGDNEGAALGYGADGDQGGAAVGYFAVGYEEGVAVGYGANGSYTGIAIGVTASGDGMGIAIGRQSNGRASGVAAGNNATGFEYGIGIGENAYGRAHGVAIGSQASGFSNAVAVGAQANADYSGVAVGSRANGALTNIAIGVNAAALGGSERIAIGHDVVNNVDNSTRIRGELYMDGGVAVFGRTPFNTGPFQRLLPLIPMDHIVWVATNGYPVGSGAIDRPFQTPQGGYDHAAATYTNAPATVVIAAGAYPGGLTMHAGNVHVVALDRAEIAELNIVNAARIIRGKQRVHNLVVRGLTIVAADLGEDVKFHNCRFAGGLLIHGPKVEVQDCYARGPDGPAVVVGDGINNIEFVALYNSSFENDSLLNGTLTVNQGVFNFEVLSCQIVNVAGGACIEDLESGPIFPVHLYTHNYLRGATPMPGSTPAVVDPMAGPAGPTIAFTQNTVLGHVGLNGNPQFYANNIIYGLINNVGGPGSPGWFQAGAGTGMDASGNTEHEIFAPPLPASWLD